MISPPHNQRSDKHNNPYDLRVQIGDHTFTLTHLEPHRLTCIKSITGQRHQLNHELTKLSQQFECAHESTLIISSSYKDHSSSPPIRLESVKLSQITTSKREGSGDVKLTFDTRHSTHDNMIKTLIGQTRKQDHLTICSDLYTSAPTSSAAVYGFDHIRFIPESMVETELDDMDLSCDFLHHHFAAPILITAMTGGIKQGRLINLLLANCAAHYEIAMSVGSQRIALEQPELEPIFAIKNIVPNVFLIGNLGIGQLVHSDAAERCRRCVEMIHADALGLHCNLVQELTQAEGNTRYPHLLKSLERCIKGCDVPVMVKEVGSGMSQKTIKRLADMGVQALDVGGRGGLSWAEVEGLRSSDPICQTIGQTFKNWGLSTAESLAAAQGADCDLPIVATGGIRNGLMMAQALRAGANMIGVGMPLLQAALNDIADLNDKDRDMLSHLHSRDCDLIDTLKTLKTSHLHHTLRTWIRELSITMMLTGSKNISQLKDAPLLPSPSL